MELFTAFTPMELKTSLGLPKEENKYLYQIKWDGIRAVVHVDAQQVKVFNRNLYDKTLQYPELQQLKKMKRKLILDGEIIVLQNGFPSFSQVIRRDFASNTLTIASLAKKLPIIYCVFDILLDGEEDLVNLPLEERLGVLNDLQEIKKFDAIYLTESNDSGKELFLATEQKKMEGIVAKEVSSTYEIGYKTGKWLKIKHRRIQNCVVCGFTIKDLRPSALVLGAYNHAEQLVYIGRAGSGLTGQDLNTLQEGTKPLVVPKPLMVNPPKDNSQYIWLEPRLTVLVEYSEWTNDLSLRAPVIKGFTNLAPEECRLT